MAWLEAFLLEKYNQNMNTDTLIFIAPIMTELSIMFAPYRYLTKGIAVTPKINATNGKRAINKQPLTLPLSKYQTPITGKNRKIILMIFEIMIGGFQYPTAPQELIGYNQTP